jgi:hypothetical protein
MVLRTEPDRQLRLGQQVERRLPEVAMGNGSA